MQDALHSLPLFTHTFLGGTGRVFVDLDPEWVDPILNYLRELAMPHDPAIPPSLPTVPAADQAGFRAALNFFGLEEHFQPSGASQSNGASDLVPRESWDWLMQECARRGAPTRPELLYRGSRDEFTAAVFQSKCHGVAHTVMIIRDGNQNVFGAYAEPAWNYRTAVLLSQSFLFLLSRNGAASHQTFQPVSPQAAQPATHSKYLAVLGQEIYAGTGRTANYSQIQHGLLASQIGSNFLADDIEVWQLRGAAAVPTRPAAPVAPTPAKAGERSISCAKALTTRFPELGDSLEQIANVARACDDALTAIERAEQVFDVEVECMTRNFENAARQRGSRRHETKSDEDEDEDEAKFEGLHDGVLHFNVGGTVVCVEQETLRQFPGSMLEVQFASGRWDSSHWDIDEDGYIFLDLNAECFRKLISVMRLKRWNPEPLLSPAAELTKYGQAMTRMLEYFAIDETQLNRGSAIPLTPENVAALRDMTNSHGKAWKLLYRGTRNGFQSAPFHRECDNHRNTVMLVQDTNRNLFGGFRDLPWGVNHGGVQQGRSNSFLFAIAQNGQECHHVFRVRGDQYGAQATFCDPNMLATFGQSLQIAQHCSQSAASRANVAQNFVVAGTAIIPSSFQVSELEVWEIEDLNLGEAGDPQPAADAAPAPAMHDRWLGRF